jgi:hypothetical protein
LSAFTEQRDWAKREGTGDVTTSDLAWEVGCKGSGLWMRVPSNYYFDVSVPWFARWLFRKSDLRYSKAAALHDYALDSGWDRVSSAALFNDALTACGVGKVERLAMTLGVIVWRWK